MHAAVAEIRRYLTVSLRTWKTDYQLYLLLTHWALISSSIIFTHHHRRCGSHHCDRRLSIISTSSLLSWITEEAAWQRKQSIKQQQAIFGFILSLTYLLHLNEDHDLRILSPGFIKNARVCCLLFWCGVDDDNEMRCLCGWVFKSRIDEWIHFVRFPLSSCNRHSASKTLCLIYSSSRTKGKITISAMSHTVDRHTRMRRGEK